MACDPAGTLELDAANSKGTDRATLRDYADSSLTAPTPSLSGPAADPYSHSVSGLGQLSFPSVVAKLPLHHERDSKLD